MSDDPTKSFATPRVAAGALFFDDRGRVLLVHPTYKDTWDIPGGYVEVGESPASGCEREIAEELGLNRRPRQLLSVDWAPNDAEGDKLLFLFDCGSIDPDESKIRLDREELDDWRWVELDHLGEFVIERIRLRVLASRAAPGSYLEHGKVIKE